VVNNNFLSLCEQLFNQLNVPVVITSEDNIIQFTNNNFGLRFDINHSFVLGQRFSETLDNIKLNKSKDDPLRLYHSTKGKFYKINKSIVNDGSKLYNLIQLNEIEIENTSESGNEDSKKHDFLFDRLDSLIWFLEKDNLFGYVNDSFAKFLGKSKSEIINKPINELLISEEAEKLEFEIAKIRSENTELRSFEYLTNSSGEKKLFSLRKFPYSKTNGKIDTVICIAEDQTELKKSEDEIKEYIEELHETKDMMEQNAYELVELNLKLEESEEELRKQNASKDKFFSIISHDLKTPVSAMMSYSEILNDEFETLERGEIKEFIQSLKEVSANLFELLEGLLNWSRVQTGRMQYSPVKINLADTSKNLIKIYDQTAKKKHIKLISEFNGKTVAYADDNMVNTVMRNLISNAIKFTNENGEIKIQITELDDFLQVSIIDNGIGIKPEDLEKLFRIDVHHTTNGTANEAGTGLGLILCKELVEKNSGEINVKSKMGEGTSFYFTLPKSPTFEI
jgi:PAS domain S-box-containing protein